MDIRTSFISFFFIPCTSSPLTADAFGAKGRNTHRVTERASAFSTTRCEPLLRRQRSTGRSSPYLPLPPSIPANKSAWGRFDRPSLQSRAGPGQSGAGGGRGGAPRSLEPPLRGGEWRESRPLATDERRADVGDGGV